MAHEVIILRSDGKPMLLGTGLRLEHAWHSWAAVGGPEEMECTAVADLTALWETVRWLRRRVEVFNELGECVWWGMVAGVELTLGAGLRMGLDLDAMYNRVRVKYTWEDATGSQRSATTDWAVDGVSVQRYGYKELQQSQADTSATAAAALRARLINKLGMPRGALTKAGGREQPGARISAVGWWQTLGWRYYAQPAGREAYEENGGKNQALGVSKTSSSIGFRSDSKRVYDTGPGFMVGHKVTVSGSGSNDGTYEVAASVEQVAKTYTASTISFAAQDDISDSAAGFSGFANGNVIQVVGSSSNDGIFEIKSFDGTNDHFEVNEKEIVAESAGSSITIQRRSYLTTVENLTEEDAGASVTLTQVGTVVAQSFTLAENVNWTLAEVALRVRSVGSPSGELRVELRADSSGSPGTVLDTGLLAASEITEAMSWRTVEMSNTDTLVYGTTYWLAVSRSSAESAESFFVLDVNEDAGYALGALKLYDGSAWVARSPDADMPFVAWGSQETTAQLEEMATEAGAFFTAVEVVDASGVYSRQYREGDNYALDEARELLEMGTSDGSRLLATVTRERRLLIFKAPAADVQTDWQLRNDGAVVSAYGSGIAPGKTPAGKWLHLAEIPGQIDAVAPLSPLFVERAQYFADGTLSIEPEGAPSPYDIGKVEQG